MTLAYIDTFFSSQWCHCKRADLYTDADVPAYSDTLGKSVALSKWHSNRIIIGIMVCERPIGNCQICHCNRGVTVTSVTVSLYTYSVTVIVDY